MPVMSAPMRRRPSTPSTSARRRSWSTPRSGALLAALLLATPLLVAGAAPANAAVPETKRVGLVDLQRVLLETTQGKAAKKDLEQALAKSNAKLERKAADLQKKFEDLQAKAAMLSEAELMKRQQELLLEEQELQELYAEVAEDLATKEGLLMEKIYKNASTIVAQMAKEEDIQLVLVRSDLTVLYANPQLDITNKVIVAYDKKFK